MFSYALYLFTCSSDSLSLMRYETNKKKLFQSAQNAEILLKLETSQ